MMKQVDLTTETMLLPLLLLLTASLCSSSPSAVVVPDVARPPIRVLQGKTSPLTQAHLLIGRLGRSGGGLCTVEVDSSDPLTQTVGQLKPKVFDCFFAEGSVLYEHEGSPLRSQDWVRLLVYSFQAGNRTEVAPIRLAVAVQLRTRRGAQGAVRREQDYIVVPGPRPLRVPRLRGTSAPIDSNALNFAYDPVTTRCIVSYSDEVGGTLAFRRWPLVGRLLDDQSERVPYFRHDCRLFLLSGYRYEHRLPPSPDTDYIPLSVRLLRLDGNDSTAAATVVSVENYYLPVHIDKAHKNLQPRLQLRRRSIELTHSGALPVVLPPDLLQMPAPAASDSSATGSFVVSAADASGSDSSDISGGIASGSGSGIVVQVIQIEPVLPFRINASFVNTREPSAGPVSGFQTEDLRDGRVAFQFASPTDTDRVELRIHLRPIDIFFQEGADVMLQLASVPNRNLQLFPAPLIAYTRAVSRFGPSNLRCIGAGCDQVNYQIRQEPYSGRLLMNNAPVQSLRPGILANQADFVVVYAHNGNLPDHDSVGLSAQLLGISDQPINFRLPIHVSRLWNSVSTLKSSTVNYHRMGPGGRVCFGEELFDESVLRYLKQDCVDLQYQVIRKPESGTLVKIVSALSDRKQRSAAFLNFSASDLLLGQTICYWQQQPFGRLISAWDSLTLRQAGRPDSELLTVRLRLIERPNATLENRSPRISESEGRRVSESPLAMLETDSSFVVTRDFLRYETAGLAPSQIGYEVLLQPHYTGANLSTDAGRLLDKRKLERIFTTGDDVKAKVRITSFKEVGCLMKFTQEDVDNGIVLYVPPLNDVGVSARSVDVYLQPMDSLRNRASPHKLTFIVQPVDNQMPELSPQRLSVERGKRLTLEPDHLRPVDVDTEVDQLTLRLVKEPKHGRLYDGEVTIGVGQWFKVSRVRAGKIWYEKWLEIP